MSLINDALKRAKDAQPPILSTSSPDGAMQPADHRPYPGRLPIYFVPSVLAILCGACFFLWRGWNEQHRLTASVRPTIVKARELEAVPVLVESDATSDEQTPGIPAGRNFSLEDDSPKTAGLTASPSLATAAVLEDLPKFGGHSYKLQGIFYRTANPSAVINSKSVFVGDAISNSRVKAIDRQSVTLECEGETKVLTLP